MEWMWVKAGTFVAVFVVITIAILVQCRLEVLTGRRFRAFIWLVASLPFALVAVAAVWLLANNPTLLSGGPLTSLRISWQCTDTVPVAQQICFRR